ncbi:MAG: PEP-CTERM sorting domain-containing protein [Bryobacterales bacterium]|nr:PEP-CTERM sorting domain-containing protein [Bryobacterales bacterium]
MRSLFLLALSSGLLSLHAGVIAGNTFDAGTEGWSAAAVNPASAGYNVVGAAPAVFQPAGGNPGGYAETDDLDTNDTMFVAPGAYLGNLLAALGGSLTYELLYTGALDYNSNDLVIKGGGIVLTYNRPIPPLSPNTWTSIAVTLAPGAGWSNHGTGNAATLADFQTVFANVTDFWILAEYTNGVVETTGLDNVVLSDAVPEPSTALLFVTGAALFLLGRRGRR